MNGVLVNVSTQIIGSELAQNYTDGLQLYVDDISVFGDEGVLQIGTIWSEDRETVPYVTIVDTDEFVEPYLELGLELVNDYVVDENVVQLYPLVEVKMATTYLPGSGDIEVPVSSGVWSLIEDGTRDEEEGEIVVIQDGMVTSLYGAPPSISGDYIAFLEAGKISAGILDADTVTIASQDNKTIIDSNGIKVTKADDESVYVEIDANEPNGKILKIVKGALEIRDKDEAVIIDKDGLVADGIIRGIMPGSNNPIINSSFERLDIGTSDPSYWTKGGSTPGNITTTESENRFGTRCFYCNNVTSTDAKATQTIQVQPNTIYALSFYYMADKLGSTPMFGSGIKYGDGTEYGEGADAGVGERGAIIRVMDGAEEKVSSDIIYGTHLDEWERVITTTFDTGVATEVDIEILVGQSDAPTVGALYLDAILLQEGAVIQPWNISLYDFLDHTSDETMHREAAYPIGSLYLNAGVATNPSDPSMLGFGTWTAFGKGKVLIGLDAGGDPDFDELTDTGGVKEHALSIAELATHGHTQDSHGHTQNSHNHTQNSHNHGQNSHGHSNTAHQHTALIYTGNQKYLSLNGGGSQYRLSWAADGWTNDLRTSTSGITITGATATNIAATAVNQGATAVNQETAAVNQTTGSGDAHTNMQPYVVVYMWKRTA